MFRSTSALAPLNVLGDALTPWITAEDSDHAYELFDFEGVEGSGPPPHAHPWAESFVMIEGDVALLVGDEERVVHAGDIGHVPADTMHTFKVLSTRARFLTLTSGDGAGRFFVDLDAHVRQLPDDLPTLMEVATRNGLSFPVPVES